MALRNTTFYGDTSLLDQVEENIIWYLKDELLKIGAYYSFNRNTTGYGGEQLGRLRPSYRPQFGNFRFWAGLTPNWVWESGLAVPGNPGVVADPIAVSGVYVSGTFYPTATTTGSYQHYIDYNAGGVVFNIAKASGLKVFCDRTERAVFTYSAGSDEYRNIITNHWRSFAGTDLPGSGIDARSMTDKAVLPAIFVGVRQVKTTPYELGGVSAFTDFEVSFNIFAENISDFNKLRSICVGLEATSFRLFNVDSASGPDGHYPLDYLGRLRTLARTRGDLITLHPSTTFHKSAHFLENSVDRVFPHVLPIHRGIVNISMQIIN